MSTYFFFQEMQELTARSSAIKRVRRTIKAAAKQGQSTVRMGRQDLTAENKAILQNEGFKISWMGDYGYEISWRVLIGTPPEIKQSSA